MDMSFELLIVAIVLALLSITLLYRVIKGPHVIDRMVAADSIDIILGLVMLIYGCYEGRAIYVDLGLILTLLGFIGTVLISKYMEDKLWLF